jgi:hypothetical protein
MNIKAIKLIGSLSLAVGIGSAAWATPITGTISFQGSGSVGVSAGVTTVTFDNDFTVTSGTVDYATLAPFGQAATLQNIKYTGDFGTAALTGQVLNQYTLTVGGVTYSFDLNSISSAHAVINNPSSIAITGSGVAHITGFQDTFGSYALNGTGTGTTFTFISESTTANGEAVPDGGTTLVLLGAALSGFALLRRKLA